MFVALQVGNTDAWTNKYPNVTSSTPLKTVCYVIECFVNKAGMQRPRGHTDTAATLKFHFSLLVRDQRDFINRGIIRKIWQFVKPQWPNYYNETNQFSFHW